MDALELSYDPGILLWMKLLSRLALPFNLFGSRCYWGVYSSHPGASTILSILYNSVLWVPSYPFYRWIWETKSSSFFIKVRVGPECWCPSWPLSHCAMYSLIWYCYTSPCLGGHTEPDSKMKELYFCLEPVSIPSLVHSSSMYWHQTWSQHWS